ncbi:MAG: InlB B-repeat-containing protein [Ruminococcus sp.]|nr:InlB B-repeat-containing protein [Ruminococcus sp.]
MRKRLVKKCTKGFVSLLLVLLVMVSLFVPGTVYAEEAATGNDIYALVYKINPKSTSNWANTEIVIQRGDTPDPSKVLLTTFSKFADGQYGTTPPWLEKKHDTSNNKYGNDVLRFVIKDRIAPASIAGWFKSTWALEEIQGLENLDTSQCTDMTEAFYGLSKLKSLDLSGFDISNVTSINRFVNGSVLESINISGFNFASVETMSEFIRGAKLTDINLSNIDVSKVKNISYFVANCTALEELDLSYFNPKYIWKLQYAFYNNTSLKKITFGQFQPGINNTADDPSTKDNRLYMNQMFAGCSSLEEIDFSTFEIPDFKKRIEYASMFEGCKSLTTLKHFENLFNPGINSDGWTQRRMFKNCESIETIDLSYLDVYVMGAEIFSGCKSLRSLDLSSMGLSDNFNNWHYQNSRTFNSSVNTGEAQTNIYEGCDELSEVVFSPYYPPANQQGSDPNRTMGYGNSKPIDREWIKIAQPSEDKYPQMMKDNKTAMPELTPLNTKLSTDELFCDFQPQYAGTWVAVSKITLNANGGTPNQQSITGARGMTLDYDPADITTPTRNGYKFKGWYADRESDESQQLAPGVTAEAWSYYAHWEDNTYSIVLHNNETPEQTETISNVKYAQFVPLSGKTFTSSDSNKVLAGWNTRANGEGMEFAANESVDKLTAEDGGTVHLYAMWAKPDVIIRFDSHGGSAIDPRYYTLTDNENVPYGNLSEPMKDGYTFMGWYTEENGQGKKVVTNETDPTTETAYVSLSTTLHAYWQKKPDVTFNLQGGTIDGDDTYVKVCDYGRAIGTIPTPVNGNQAFMGWFTEAQGGTEINSSTKVTGDVTYYAHWGWQPKFETNGGSYIRYTDSDGTHFANPNYPVQSSSSYNLGTLPVVERENYTFDGWYIGDTDTQIHDNETVDLSQNSVFKAHWSLNPICTITLDFNDNSTPNKTIKVYKSQSNEDQNIIGELPTPTREGYRFDGWYDGSDNKYTYQSRISSEASDTLTLTARWTEESHTVTFDPTDGEMVGSTTYTVADGKTLTYLPGANFTDISGSTTIIKKSFDGWYTERNGGGTKLTTATQINADTTYYANWVDNRKSADNYNSMIRWGTLSGNDVTNLGDTLVFHPSASGNISAHLTVDFALENQNNQLPAGAVRITLPKKFFTGWDGETDVTTTESTFTNFNVETSDDGEYYILTNATVFKSTVLEPVYTVDPMRVPGGYVDENGVCRDYFNKEFNVKIEMKNDNDEFVTFQERTLGVELHTDVQTSVYKEQASATLSWSDSWGEKPSDADEYFYVVWTLNASNYNSNQPYQLKWSENTVHDGSVVYSTGLDTWSNEHTTDANHRITVVTKHRRDEAMAQGAWAEVKNEAILNVKWKSGYEQQFRTTGTATAYVGEIIDGNVRTLEKTIPDEYTQEKHYIYGGQDLILNSDVEHLDRFVYNLSYTEKTNQDNPTWTQAGEMSVTPRTYVLTDGVKGRGDVIVTAEKPTGANTRSQWTGANNQETLDDGDYYFTYLDINVTEYDSVYLNGDWANPYENDNLYDYGDIKVYYRTMGSSDFELLKTVTHDEMGLSTQSGSDFEKGYEARIVLPGDTVGYKIEYTSSRYTTDIKVNTAFKLKNSRKVHSLVSTHANAGKHTLLKNKSVMNIQRDGKPDIVADSTDHNAWLSAYELTLSESELYAAKSCLNETTINKPENYFVTDSVASTVEFPVAITGWAYSKNQLGYIKRVKSGIFHDLLPHGFIVDRSKIIVCGRTDEQARQRGSTTINSQKSSANATSYSNNAKEFPGQISSDYYSVTFKDNWEGSGQTMMIINVNCPEDMTATGFVVYYKCKTTINNLHINGTTPKNYIAFTDTTPEQSLPETRINTRNYLDSATRPLFASVDNDQTAYNYSTTTLKTPNVYQYGADSNVTTEGADIAKHQVVGLNTGYSYNISYEGDTSTQTHDLVVYDVIERQINGSTSQWMGEFQSVDVTSIKNQYSADESDGKCAPVVYYATKPKDEFTKEMFDLSLTDIWSTTPPSDMKDVTAVAIDCRKTDSGKDFVLGVKKGIDLTINMMSPDDEERSDIETYNEAVVTGFNQEIGRNLILNTLTSVTLRFTKPQFIKSAFPASGTQDNPESVVNGSVMDYILTVTNPDPEIPMANIVIEDKFPMALVPNNYYKVRFNDGDSILIDNTLRVSYSVTTGKNDNNEDVRVFTATVDVLDPGDTVEITIPVKVGLEKGTNISNEAKITSINGVPYSNITSNTTYHTVTGVKAKILKVNAKDEPLSGATLEIYERNETNCDAQGNLKSGATPMSLKNDNISYGTAFTSSDEVSHFDVAAGEYILHETAVPADSGYKLAEDIPFTIDVEGIIYVNGEPVNYVKMVDEPAYKVIFHENKPAGTADEIQKIFRIYEPMDLTDGKITHFYDIPEWAGDEYVFAGWYHNSGYTECDTPDSAAGTASNFENDTYTERDTDYHLYAKWIKVGNVQKDGEDANIINGYRGFGLAGVQIRDPQMYDENYTGITSGGMRFVTSLSEELLSKIDALSSTKVETPEGNVNVEYGYAVGTEANINDFINHYNVEDTTAYTLQYKGENVNGKNTTVKGIGANTDYRYITNVNCTKGTGKIAKDHRNFTDYRLYTLVVTYEGDSALNKAEKIDARSYIRYYDANGKLRVFYNTYKKNAYYGGCLCSFNQVNSMALAAQPPKEAEAP